MPRPARPYTSIAFNTRITGAQSGSSLVSMISNSLVFAILAFSISLIANDGNAIAQSRPPTCQHSAQLYNLDSPTRVPGEYIVMFRPPAALACFTVNELNSLRVLPGVIPNSEDASRRLAQALAQSIGARLVSVSAVGLPEHFLIVSSDQAVRALAHDPRIATIEANLTAAFQ